MCGILGAFAHHNTDAKTERMKLLVIDDLGDDMVLCRYVHHKELKTNPERKFHVSEIIIDDLGNYGE